MNNGLDFALLAADSFRTEANANFPFCKYRSTQKPLNIIIWFIPNVPKSQTVLSYSRRDRLRNEVNVLSKTKGANMLLLVSIKVLAIKLYCVGVL